VRVAATVLLWLLTTAALTATVPTAWAQHNIVDADGYAALAQRAAADPALRAAAASELSSKATTLISQRGYRVDPQLVREVATAYTGGPTFAPQFAQANRLAHQWLFTNQSGLDPWVVDLAPMLKDEAFQQLLADYHVRVPSMATVPLTVSTPKTLQPGKLRTLATWGPWVSIAAAALTGICALLTLAAARNRGRALAALGVSALLAGGAGWAALEIARRRINGALNHTAGDLRRIADVMVTQAEASLHHWLDLTMAAGGVLVVFGVLVAILGSLRPRA
jgi:hypothetical protein